MTNLTNKEAIDILKSWGKSLGTEKTKEAFNMAVEALEMQDTYDWLFRTPPDPNWVKTFEEVEKALGFKLFIWQKTYIATGSFRQYGKTTAEILSNLLDVEKAPLDLTKEIREPRKRWLINEVEQIKRKLDKAGIETRTVFFCNQDKIDYKKKRVREIHAKWSNKDKLLKCPYYTEHGYCYDCVYYGDGEEDWSGVDCPFQKGE